MRAMFPTFLHAQYLSRVCYVRARTHTHKHYSLCTISRYTNGIRIEDEDNFDHINTS